MKENNVENIDNIAILPKLELLNEERDIAKRDISEMLGFIDKMNELDTEGIEAVFNVGEINNVFREGQKAVPGASNCET
jgi:aspartyl-tRNA(Asn)/glutamyl-tRNA(Gln) amidotransferase subunit C